MLSKLVTAEASLNHPGTLGRPRQVREDPQMKEEIDAKKKSRTSGTEEDTEAEAEAGALKANVLGHPDEETIGTIGGRNAAGMVTDTSTIIMKVGTIAKDAHLQNNHI
jgi:hypothetical protein